MDVVFLSIPVVLKNPRTQGAGTPALCGGISRGKNTIDEIKDHGNIVSRSGRREGGEMN